VGVEDGISGPLERGKQEKGFPAITLGKRTEAWMKKTGEGGDW